MPLTRALLLGILTLGFGLLFTIPWSLTEKAVRGKDPYYRYGYFCMNKDCGNEWVNLEDAARIDAQKQAGKNLAMKGLLTVLADNLFLLVAVIAGVVQSNFLVVIAVVYTIVFWIGVILIIVGLIRMERV